MLRLAGVTAGGHPGSIAARGALPLSDLRNALAANSASRIQVARDTQFRVIGAAGIAASGALARRGAAAKSRSGHQDVHVSAFIPMLGDALVTVVLTAAEMYSRARKVHSEFEMIDACVEQFLPVDRPQHPAHRGARPDRRALPGL